MIGKYSRGVVRHIYSSTDGGVGGGVATTCSAASMDTNFKTLDFDIR